MANWFSKKDELVDAFSNIKDIGKILVFAESITSEGIKEKLIDKIKQSELKEYLEKSHWIPEIQSTLSKIIQYPVLITKAEEIIKYWEENSISERNHEYGEYLYQTKLLIAYQKEDLKEIHNINPPKNKAISVGTPNYADYKMFYSALLKINNAPEESYNTFNSLALRYPKYPVFALNRMASKMNLAEKIKDIDIYREAIEEWKEYSGNNEYVDEESLGLIFFSNLMQIHYYLSDFNLLDDIYIKLDLPDRMNPKVLDIKTDSLIKRGKIEEALILLDEASDFHKYSKNEDIEFILHLKNKVSGIDNIEELKVYYGRIMDNSPKKLIKILPGKFNGKIDITEFITKEVAIAANKMLDKINSVSSIKNEDKYNDLVLLTLESRLTTFGWTVKDQTRKAFSPSSENSKEKNLGEIDLDILDYNKISFITCEAFILRDTPRVQSHIEKVIAHYTSRRAAFLILVYFTGAQKNFEKKWQEYSTSIVPKLKFPIGFNMTSKSIIDLSQNYDVSKSAIKVGKSEHEDETCIYHVFVNINYQITN